MTFIEYIVDHTDKLPGHLPEYKCGLSGKTFYWEYSEWHIDYLIKNKLIEPLNKL